MEKYKKQKKYWYTEAYKKRRAKGNAARRMMEKEGRVKKGDGKEVDHKVSQAEGGSNKRSNLRVVSRKTNRVKGGQLGGKRKGEAYKKKRRS